MEVLLPPKWEPASSAKKANAPVPQGQNMPESTLKTKMNFKLNESLEPEGRSTSVDGPPTITKRKDYHIFDNAPAIVVSLTDSIKPKEHGDYMESDDPTQISNIRRSLIQQEYPNSDFHQASAAQIKSTMTGLNLEQTISDEEEQQVSNLLDEAVNLPPSSAVSDSPDQDDSEQGESRNATTSRKMGTEADLHHIKNRIRNQHNKFKKRHLDHSEFTSEEDLPYQGDSDISLPLEILFRVALYINQAKAANKIESTLVSVTTNSIDILVNSLTAFERIVHTPIPKAYNIHL